MVDDYRARNGVISRGITACRKTILNLGSLLSALALLTLGGPALSQEVVWPGESIKFVTATSGAEGCRRGQVSFTCGLEFLGETTARPNVNEVETSAQVNILPGSGGHLGVPFYSEASISNDFFIPGPPDNVVDVHFTVAYDFFGNMASAGLYTLGNSLSLRIQDRTYNTFVASHELISMQRQGDQGFTDVSLAQERAALPVQVGHFTAKLRRGGLYRLHFELQSSAVSFIAGLLRADAFARWHFLTVSVDEDEVEQLAIHDGDIKAKLQGFDDDLQQIKDDIAEVKELLQTPQGLRPGFPNNPSRNKGRKSGPRRFRIN